MGKRVNRFMIESFINNIGQIITPGDKVIAVTSSKHIIKTITGVFEGVYLDTNGKVVGTRVGNIPVKKFIKEYNDNGKYQEFRYDLSEPVQTDKRYDLVQVTKHRRSVLKQNLVFKFDTSIEQITKL